MKKQEFMRKTYPLTIIACLLVLVFGGCHHTPSQKAMMLQRADSLMEEHPDSSLTILEKITSPEKLSQGDYALWCLLITQARDKNYITHTSDSLINIAVNYFSKKGDPSRMAQSYYVQGRVENDLESYEKALTAYLNARKYVQQTNHDRLNARINNHLGTLYLNQGFYLKSKICYEQALSSFVKGNDTTGTVNALRNIGDSFYSLGQNDSALFYLNKAYLLANEGNVNSQKAYVFAYLGNVYEAFGDLQQALYYNLQSLNYPHEINLQYSRLYTIAELYDELQRPDSAFFYAKKALESPDIYHRCGMNRLLYHLYFKQHEYDKAYFHNKQYDLLKDSIHSESQSVKLAKVEALYNKDRLVYEKQQQKQEDEIKILALLFLFVIIGIVFLWIYQRSKEQLRQYKEHLRENELLIHKNEERIHDLSKEKERQVALLSSSQETAEQKIEELNDKRMALQANIDQVEQIMMDLSDENKSLLQEKEELQRKIKNAPVLPVSDARENQNKIYTENAKRLNKIILQDDPVFAPLLNSNVNKVTAEQWQEIENEVNRLYNDFTLRLSSQFPWMNDNNRMLLCLLKLSVPNKTIAQYLCIDERSVVKQKRRIREQIRQHSGAEIDNDRSFDLWLCLF